MNEATECFVFALCNPGSERALKVEVAMAGLDMRPSYQRRGFVTFKVAVGNLPAVMNANFGCALRLCVSEGKFESLPLAESRLREAGAQCLQHLKWVDHRIRPQVDGDPPLPAHGTNVGTLVELSQSECWAGVHVAGPWISPYPGGNPALEMPDDAPSRAWLKFEEALRFFGLEITARDLVVELGCAPGGVVHAMLQRGVPVIGVDPAGMDPVVMRHAIARREDAPAGKPWFYHCRKPAALCGKRDIGQGVTWFMSDMNQSPEVVLKECARFVRMAPSIRGVLLTLKLGQMEEVARKNDWLAALRDLGCHTAKLQQLPSHHREFALLGVM